MTTSFQSWEQTMAALSIGFLVGTTYDAWEDYIVAFTNQLGTHGWKAGRDFNIEYQPAAGQSAFYPVIAADFANTGRSNPIDVIVTGGTDATIACINATKAKPQIKVVFATAGKPGAYLVGLSPGNVTGISNEQTLHVPDRLKHMKAHANVVAPPFRVFGLIGNAYAANVQDEMSAVMAQATGAPPLNLTAVQSTIQLQTVADIHSVIQNLKAKGAQALYVCTDPLITSNADILNEWAIIESLPTMHAFKKNWGQTGNSNKLYWGPKLEDMFGQAADFVYTWRTTGSLPPPATPAPGSFEHYPVVSPGHPSRKKK
jgi:ABC-type uncharacterized transport system substrate-binding protein